MYSNGLAVYLNQQGPILPMVVPPVQREWRREKSAADRLPTGRHHLHLPLGGGATKAPSMDTQRPKQPREQETLIGCHLGKRWQQGARARRRGYDLEGEEGEEKKAGIGLGEAGWSQTLPRRRDCWMGCSKSSKSWRRFSRKSLLYGNVNKGGNSTFGIALARLNTYIVERKKTFYDQTVGWVSTHNLKKLFWAAFVKRCRTKLFLAG